MLQWQSERWTILQVFFEISKVISHNENIQSQFLKQQKKIDKYVYGNYA